MKPIRLVLRTVAVLLVVVCVLDGLAALGVFPQGSLLEGASYLPPSWFAPFVFAAALLAALARERKPALALLAAFAVCVLPQADVSLGAGAVQPRPGAATLSVMALNVQYYTFGVARVAQTIRDVDPDVALLSENVLDAAQAAQLRAAFAPRQFHMGRPGETAIVSRYPVREFHEVDFPTWQASLSGPNDPAQQSPREHRSFTHAVIDVNGAPVNVLSVRLIAGRPKAPDPLSQLEWGLYLLRAQQEEVEALRRYLSGLRGPVIFGGDLNAPPSSPAVRRLRALATDAVLATHHLTEPTFRVRRPLIRIDYLFGTGEAIPLEAHRVNVETSDHFPVYARFQLPAAGARAHK